MAITAKKEVRYTAKPIKQVVKPGHTIVVSGSLVKPSSSNLVPKVHVKRGDTVILTSGSKANGKGKTGKVLSVLPKEGKVVVEGVNVQTHFVKARSVSGPSGIITKEGPIFASKVMLYCTSCKKPTRIRHKEAAGAKKTRICTHCKEAFDA